MPKFKLKKELIVLALIILLATLFRFWQIREYVIFLGDEGRDMLVMRKIFTEGQIPFLGPTASVGGFYLGPIYYWMAAPFLFLWNYDPVGPAYFIAAIGVLTVILLYKFLKETAGFWPAVFASTLYAVAPLVVRYSRSSWNPNPLPFFSLLLMYFLYLGISRKKPFYFVLAGGAFGIAVQLHYLAIILIILSALVIAFNTNFKKWTSIFVLSFMGFLITFSPFLLFELRHNFPNFKTILEFVTRGTTVGYRSFNLLWLVSNTGNILLEELTNLKDTFITKTAFWLLLLGSIFGLSKYWKDEKKRTAFLIGIVWFFAGLTSIRLYTGQIFSYYFGTLFPAPFFLLGLVFYLMWQKFYLRFFVVIISLSVLGFFLTNSIFKYPPNKLIDQTEDVADFVIEKSENKPFNFAMISDSNSDHAYRYFLEIKGHKPTDLETLVTDQLIVVCESKKCSPLGHPTWEVAGFGRGEISGEWELTEIGIRVFRLIHWEGAPSPAGKPAIKGT